MIRILAKEGFCVPDVSKREYRIYEKILSQYNDSRWAVVYVSRMRCAKVSTCRKHGETQRAARAHKPQLPQPPEKQTIPLDSRV